jgi:hypothetical protein
VLASCRFFRIISRSCRTAQASTSLTQRPGIPVRNCALRARQRIGPAPVSWAGFDGDSDTRILSRRKSSLRSCQDRGNTQRSWWGARGAVVRIRPGRGSPSKRSSAVRPTAYGFRTCNRQRQTYAGGQRDTSCGPGLSRVTPSGPIRVTRLSPIRMRPIRAWRQGSLPRLFSRGELDLNQRHFGPQPNGSSFSRIGVAVPRNRPAAPRRPKQLLGARFIRAAKDEDQRDR